MKNILIVDDDVDDCLLTQQALQRSYADPINFSVVHDGEALLVHLQKQRTQIPDLILLDLNMPKIDGREALAKLRADPRHQALPIVILTTSTAIDDIQYAYRLGANSYISKAVTFEQMSQSMASLVDYWFNVVKLPTWHV